MISWVLFAFAGLTTLSKAQSYYLSHQYQITAQYNGTYMYGVDSSGALYFFNQSIGEFYKATLSAGTYSLGYQFTCCSGQGVWAEAVAASNGDIYYTTGSNPNSVISVSQNGFRSSTSGPSNFYVGAVSADDTTVFGSAGATMWVVKNGVASSLGGQPLNFIAEAVGPGNSLYVISGSVGASLLTVQTPSGSGYSQTTYPIAGTITNRTVAVDNQGNVYFIQNNNLVELIAQSNGYVQYVVATIAFDSGATIRTIGIDGNNNIYVAASGSSNLTKVYELSSLPVRNDSSMTKGLNVSANSQELDYLGTDSHIHQIYNNGVLASGDLTVAAGGPAPAVGSALFTRFSSLTGHQEVDFVGPDQHIHQLWYDADSWHHVDLTSSYGGPLVANGSPLTGGDDPLGPTSEVDYLGTDLHVHSFWYSANAWHSSDLTTIASAPAAASNSKLATAFNTISQHYEIDYLGQDQHVHQLYYDSTGWHASDLTAVTGATLAANGSSLDGHITYVGIDQHIHQIWFNGSNWQHTDLTTVTGASLAQFGSAIAIDQSPGSVGYEISYVGTDQHLHVLYYQNSAWNTADLTSIANSPIIAPNSPVTAGYDIITSQPEIEYVGLDQHIYQLHYGSQGWQYSDLTSLTGATLVQ